MKKLRAFVTGSNGFIGRSLVTRLIKNSWHVSVLARQENYNPGTLFKESGKTTHLWDSSTQGLIDILAQAKPDIVFHLATFFIAQHSSGQIDELIDSNIKLGTQLAEAMSLVGTNKMINFGTSWQHYQNRSYSPASLYAATKQAYEAILQFYVEARKFDIVTLKVFDTLGPNDNRNKIFPELLKIAASGERLNLSPGHQMVDFIHVSDVINATMMAADGLITGNLFGMSSFSLSSGQAVSLREFVNIVEEVIERPLNVVWGARPYRDREVMALWDDGKRLPGWSPQYSLREAIKLAVEGHV